MRHTDDMTDATRILVIDDDPRIRAVVRRGLAYEGYRVVEAATGEEGLEKAREHLPDLVILDVMMPGIDGLEVTRRLRAAGDEVAILMLTARDEVKDRVEGLTTAAGIWSAAAIGMSFGFGLYLLGIGTTVLLLIAFAVIGRVLPDTVRSGG